MNILITGIAGFIGYHLAEKLSKEKKINKLIGVDNLNSYYDVNIKKNRLKKLKKNKKILFYKYDINNIIKLNRLIRNYKSNNY